MEFFTKVQIPTAPFSITHQQAILLLGSCFTENIGNYLKQYQFTTNTNPFGIIYNPVSIFANLNNIIHKKEYTEDDLLQHGELFISLDHHGQFSGTDKNEVLTNINTAIEKAHADFNASEYVFITPGTAFVYHHLKQNRVVANCHKIPNTAFEKRLLTTDEIKAAFNAISKELENKKVLFTISPVRHWRDGATENQRSKSILTESIHQLIEENTNCFYFPAFEIVMDELRDYRFYAEDMLHPNAIAVKYIWERFSETYFNEDTLKINTQLEKINLLRQHRVKHADTEEKVSFERKIASTISAFQSKYPDILLRF